MNVFEVALIHAAIHIGGCPWPLRLGSISRLRVWCLNPLIGLRGGHEVTTRYGLCVSLNKVGRSISIEVDQRFFCLENLYIIVVGNGISSTGSIIAIMSGHSLIGLGLSGNFVLSLVICEF